MNYEEMSDHEISLSVIYKMDSSLNDTTFYEVTTYVGHPSVASVFDTESSDLCLSFDCNNPGDWGKLMDDNKISLNWWVDEEGGNDDTWNAGTSKRWQNANHKTSPGRAISICYLKSKEAE